MSANIEQIKAMLERTGKTNLLQKQKVDLVAELKHHLATTPKEQLEKEWKELEPWGNIGPTVQEFLYGKQPEVYLNENTMKKEFRMIDSACLLFNYNKLSREQLIARRFYQLGLKARKEK